MISILVVDDHPVVREGLKQILQGMPETVVLDEAGSAQETLGKISENDYDMVILDISLPDRNGLDVLKDLRRMKPVLRILVVTMHPEEQYALRTLKAGAYGYLTKDAASDELVLATRTICSGRKYIGLSVAEKLAFALDTEAEKLPHELLSNREYQVMCMIASGKTTTEIARELMLSVKTVSTYRSRILSKMRLKNNMELIHYAIKHRLVD
ncbi:MAG: response regulator transcription factor [Dehalococcoidia bacterium]|nr:response regulator transcription factor [Dehalococcoidia bacterium]